jgi:PAS domain-containing protein
MKQADAVVATKTTGAPRAPGPDGHFWPDTMADVLRQMPYTIQVIDTEGTVLMVNKALTDLYGIGSEKDVVGRVNLFQDDFLKKNGIEPYLKAALKGKITTIPELKISAQWMSERYKARIKEDQYRQLTLFPLKAPGGKVRAVVIMGVDISRLKHAQK